MRPWKLPTGMCVADWVVPVGSSEHASSQHQSLLLRARATTYRDKFNFQGLQTTPTKSIEMPCKTIGTPSSAKRWGECRAGGTCSWPQTISPGQIPVHVLDLPNVWRCYKGQKVFFVRIASKQPFLNARQLVKMKTSFGTSNCMVL
jgi:hypothetical protein